MYILSGQYRTFIRSTFSIVVLVQVILVVGILKNYLNINSISNNFLFQVIQIIGLPSAALVGVLLVQVYEQQLWKWANPRYNFSGKWYLVDKFYTIHPDAGARKIEAVTYGWIIIQQSPLELFIIEGTSFLKDGSSLSSWHSNACNLSLEGSTLIAALSLSRRTLDETELPNANRAVDEITVVERATGLFPIPTRLSGKTYHCVGEGHRAMVGFTDYFREKPKDFPF